MARFLVFALAVLVGCDVSVDNDGSPGGAQEGGGGAVPALGGAADGGAAEAGAAHGGAGSVGEGGAAECEDEKGDPECNCSSSDWIDICTCQCGDTVVRDIDAINLGWHCDIVDGTPCEGDAVYSECEQTDRYKLCGP